MSALDRGFTVYPSVLYFATIVAQENNSFQRSCFLCTFLGKTALNFTQAYRTTCLLQRAGWIMP